MNRFGDYQEKLEMGEAMLKQKQNKKNRNTE